MSRPIHIRDEKSRQIALDFIAGLNLDKEWDVTVERHKDKRSLSQNALLHRWFGIIADETGNTRDDIKEAYRDMFLDKVPVQIGGKECLVGRSTTKLSTAEMAEFMDKVQAHAASELGILLPLPFQQGREMA